jgi:hypothetical protein
VNLQLIKQMRRLRRSQTELTLFVNHWFLKGYF